MDIILRGGPCDGEVHREVDDRCLVFGRYAKEPGARYVDGGDHDAGGIRIFDYVPPSAPPAGRRIGRRAWWRDRCR